MKPLIASTLEMLINQALKFDSPSLQTLNQLSGQIICIELSGLDLKFTLFPDNQGIIILSDYEGEVDVHIKAAPFTLLNLLRQPETTLSNNPDVIIDGKMSIAQQLLHFLKGLDIDWEKQVAQWLGDFPAHKLGTLFQQCQAYTHERLNALPLNLSKYLQEKTRFLPSRAEMEHFLKAVNGLHDDLDRLVQRVQRLNGK